MGYINTKTDRKNLYMNLSKEDVISKLRLLLDQKGFHIRPDGRFSRAPDITASAWDTPWLHQHQINRSECHMWHDLFFPYYNMVPSYCKDCWKVVIFIPTVEKLFDLYELQHDFVHPCKCGIEYRYTDERNYGGYWYNRGKKEGLECYKQVRELVDKRLGKNIKVILKCSCSEYEVSLGPPDDWEITQKQIDLEKMWNDWISLPDIKHTQQRYMTAFVMLKWLHHAAHIGDLTYKKFTNGKSLVKTMKTYHDEIQEKTDG